MPSMSYCMFENTTLEMNQILATMDEAESMDELDLNSYEQEAFSRLVKQCQKFLDEAERLGCAETRRDADGEYICMADPRYADNQT